EGVGYIDLFRHMLNVYIASEKSGPGDPITVGRLPNDIGHMVAASLVLHGLNAPAERLSSLGWSPLLPRKMARVRNALALPLKAPGAESAAANRDLFIALGPADEKFFQAWRLGGGKHPTRDRAELLPQAEQAWQQAATLAKQTYGKR